MLGLEYLLLFGVPDNKWQVLGGRSRWAFPFLDREVAEAHFVEWSRALQVWKGAEPVVREKRAAKGTARRVARIGDAEMTLYPGPIELSLPMDLVVFDALYDSFWRRDLWPGQDAGKETGWECSQRHHDVRTNLWKLFGEFVSSHGGLHCGRSVIAVDDRNAVEPDQYYFQGTRKECLINGDYFQGVPWLIAEVLSPSTRAIDRGPRMEVYRKVGVPHLWLLDPEVESVEEYALEGRQYRLVGRHGEGQTFAPAAFSEGSVEVDRLFDRQQKRHAWGRETSDIKPLPEWLVPADRRVGLEVLLFLGHPERRYEIWDNRAVCLLAFGSTEEAKLRFGHFLEELCRWEQVEVGRATEMEPGVDVAEIGRFVLRRQGHQVRLDVAVDGRKFRELLMHWSDRRGWDWGEK
jgi:Uma2 family endonuclease